MKEQITNADIELVVSQTGYAPSNQTSNYSGVKAAYAWLSAQNRISKHQVVQLKPIIRRWGLCYLNNDDIAIAAEILKLLDKQYYDRERIISLRISRRFSEPQIAPQSAIPDYGTSPSYGD